MACCKDDLCAVESIDNKLKSVFLIVLLINLVMFLVEIIYGIRASSNALIADSLDMLGDTFVYAITLYVISKGTAARANASLLKGFVMLLLGLYVVFESINKVLNPVIPTGEIISAIGAIALVANLVCFLLLIKYKSGDLNVRSAWICSRNDVIANISVIIAGFFVLYFNSMWPDIIVGLGISFIVLQSSFEIIKEAWTQKRLISV